MSFLEAFILGVIQGIAEFLPISSSGHLAVARNFMGFGEIPRLFDVLLHVASLIVILWIYRLRVRDLVLALFTSLKKADQEKRSKIVADRWLIAFLIFSTLCTLAVVILLDLSAITSWNLLTPVAFIFTGFFLLATRFVSEKENRDKISWPLAIGIGLAQGFGTIAGISRSGITIGTARFMGLERQKAGEYSFLLSIPAILGALVLDLKDGGALLESISLMPLLVAFLTTLVVGYFSLSLLLRIIKKGKFYYFSFYLIPLGAGLLFLGM